MNEKKIIGIPIERNSMKIFSRYHDHNNFNFPETKQTYCSNRFKYILEQMKVICIGKPDVIPILITHGSFTTGVAKEFLNKDILTFNYGSVNRFVLENKSWRLDLFDEKFYNT